MKTLYTPDELRQGVTRMAVEIADRYADQHLTIISVLTGSVVLVADLIRMIDLPMRLGVIEASSYRGDSTERGELVVNAKPMLDISGRDVLLVDDIFDTGHTLVKTIEKIREFNPASVRSAVLLHKQGRQEVEAQPDFVGFNIPNEFVVGYGLDYEDLYRNLPYLAVLEEEDLKRHRELASKPATA